MSKHIDRLNELSKFIRIPDSILPEWRYLPTGIVGELYNNDATGISSGAFFRIPGIHYLEITRSSPKRIIIFDIRAPRRRGLSQMAVNAKPLPVTFASGGRITQALLRCVGSPGDCLNQRILPNIDVCGLNRLHDLNFEINVSCVCMFVFFNIFH